MKTFDLVVVGGGILGTFHAYHALERGLSVLLIERDRQPRSASTRNFGQIVPSGMNLKWQRYGRKSLQLYKHIQSEWDITVEQHGSIYLASNEEEVQLLEELRDINRDQDYASELLTKDVCLARYPGLNNDYVQAGLFFPDEINVEPTRLLVQIHDFLVQRKNLELLCHTTVKECRSRADGVEVKTTSGTTYSAKQVVICNGSEFKILFPQEFAESDLEVSKLQMMRTQPQPDYTLRGSILTGRTIRRYEAFEECPSFKAIKSNEDPNSAYARYGIHVLFKQANDGSVIIGDSHEYADANRTDELSYDLNMEIDRLIIDEAKRIFDLPTYEIQHRWFGQYCQSKTSDIFEHSVDENIHIVTGIGGKGMTGSAGYAGDVIDKLFNLTTNHA